MAKTLHTRHGYWSRKITIILDAVRGPAPSEVRSAQKIFRHGISLLPLKREVSRQPGRPRRFFNKIKQRWRIATRYDKPAANYHAFIKLASIRI